MLYTGGLLLIIKQNKNRREKKTNATYGKVIGKRRDEDRADAQQLISIPTDASINREMLLLFSSVFTYSVLFSPPIRTILLLHQQIYKPSSTSSHIPLCKNGSIMYVPPPMPLYQSTTKIKTRNPFLDFSHIISILFFERC